MESDLKLYEVKLNDWFWVVVRDGEDPIQTLLDHCPDYLLPEDFFGYWDREWPEDWGDYEIIDALIPLIEVTERIEPVDLDYGAIEAAKLNPSDWDEDWDDETDWCSAIYVPVPVLLAVSKHGDMWSERWAE